MGVVVGGFVWCDGVGVVGGGGVGDVGKVGYWIVVSLELCLIMYFVVVKVIVVVDWV